MLGQLPRSLLFIITHHNPLLSPLCTSIPSLLLILLTYSGRTLSRCSDRQVLLGPDLVTGHQQPASLALASHDTGK